MKPLIAGNWKMHGDMQWSAKLSEFKTLYPISERAHIDVLVCPPAPFIAPLVKAAEEAGLFLGGQNCHAKVSGAHTGEISADMLRDVGANFVIVGHSERRTAGETDADVQAKAEAALNAKLTPIICVGETLAQRQTGLALDVVSAQLKASLPNSTLIKRSQAIVIAYEPVWAIGTGKTATLDDITDMHTHISELTGGQFRLLYGGSVKPDNAKAILGIADVNGALIGGASLKMDAFAAIAKSV